jgi:hypothetical protein
VEPGLPGGEERVDFDDGWNMRAITPFDVSAKAASDRIVDASETGRAPGMLSDPNLDGSARALGYVAEISTGVLYNSDRPDGRPATAIDPAADNQGLTSTAATVGTGGSIDHTREFFVLNQLDQATASSLATAATAPTDHVGRIVDYLT